MTSVGGMGRVKGQGYYNLHYKGDQVGISDKEEQVGKTNPSFYRDWETDRKSVV